MCLRVRMALCLGAIWLFGAELGRAQELPRSSLPRQCDLNSECDYGLVCHERGRCIRECRTSRDCGEQRYCVRPVQEADQHGQCVGLPAISEAWKTSLEVNMDRPGSDIDGFWMSSADPWKCHAACRENWRCRSWTYVEPGIHGQLPRCYLKSATPAQVAMSGVVSGVLSDRTGGITVKGGPVDEPPKGKKDARRRKE